MNEILNTILKDTYTLKDLKHRLNILKSYLSQSFFGTGAIMRLEEKDSAWLKSLPSSMGQHFNKDNISTVFAELEKGANQLKTLVIYLAFEPDQSGLALIGNYARKTFGNSLLLDIKYDPNLIAGAAFVWKGIYKDYSLRASIEQKKALILDSFKKFLR